MDTIPDPRRPGEGATKAQSEGTTGTRLSARRPFVSLLLRLSLSLLLMGYVLWSADWTQLRTHARSVDPLYLGLFVAITPVLAAVTVWKWQLLLEARGYRVSFFKLFLYFVLGQFYNNVLPSSVGGDVMRAVALNREIRSVKEAAASIVVERFAGLTVLVVLAVGGLLGAEALRTNPVMVGLVGAGVALYLGIAVAVLERRVLGWLRPLIDRWRPLGALITRLERFQEALRSYRRFRGALLWSLVLSMVFYLGTMLNVYLACRTVGVVPSLWAMSLAVPVVLLVSMLPVTLNGLGLTEWAYMTSFAALGVPATAGLTASLLLRVKGVLWSASGYLVHVSLELSGATAASGEPVSEGRSRP